MEWRTFGRYSDVMSDVTQILSQIEQGDPNAAEELLPLVYQELRQLAAARLANEKPGQTLQATALVHDAYIRLVGDPQRSWDSRGHFFSAAAEAMRRILIERARHKRSQKAGGDFRRQDLDVGEIQVPTGSVDLLALDDALQTLAEQHPRAATLVKLRFFAGLSNAQAAKAMGVSPSTADNDWVYAKGWLYLAMSGD